MLPALSHKSCNIILRVLIRSWGIVRIMVIWQEWKGNKYGITTAGAAPAAQNKQQQSNTTISVIPNQHESICSWLGASPLANPPFH